MGAGAVVCWSYGYRQGTGAMVGITVSGWLCRCIRFSDAFPTPGREQHHSRCCIAKNDRTMCTYTIYHTNRDVNTTWNRTAG